MALSHFLMKHICGNSLYYAQVRVLIVTVIHLEALLTEKHSHSYWNAYVGIPLLNPPRLTRSSLGTAINSKYPQALMYMCLGNHNCHQLCISQNIEIQSWKECNHPNPIQLKRQMGILQPLRDYSRSQYAVGYCMGSMGLSFKCVD